MRRFSIQKRLGLPKETKLLIIHADDLGLCHSSNLASIHSIEKGMVNSGSIMVPCPGFPEIARYFSSHSESDFGIHLTLTSEWHNYKWKPILHIDAVPSLVDKYGFFPEEVSPHFNFCEVELELRAQIERAFEFGIKPTHLDCHTFCLFKHEELMRIYIRLGNEYKLPVLLNNYIASIFKLNIDNYTSQDTIIIDSINMAMPEDALTGLDNYYVKTLTSLRNGLNVILIHPAHDDQEMQDISMGVKEFGATWRQMDYNFFTSELCREIIEKESVKMITWKEIKEKLIL